MTYGVALWHSKLRIQHCHCNSSGHYYGTVESLAWELPHVKGAAIKKKGRKDKNIQITKKEIQTTLNMKRYSTSTKTFLIYHTDKNPCLTTLLE